MKVLDLKFIYENSLMALISVQGRRFQWLSLTARGHAYAEAEEIRIIRIPHQSAELGYKDYAPDAPTSSHALSAEQVLSVFPNMIVPSEGGFLPTRMEVKEASTERGNIPTRLCLLGEDMKMYKVFALPDEFL